MRMFIHGPLLSLIYTNLYNFCIVNFEKKGGEKRKKGYGWDWTWNSQQLPARMTSLLPAGRETGNQFGVA